MTPNDRQKDDPSSAPESGTDRDETSGNAPASPHSRPGHSHSAPGDRDRSKGDQPQKDDPSTANEEP